MEERVTAVVAVFGRLLQWRMNDFSFYNLPKLTNKFKEVVLFLHGFYTFLKNL